MHHPTTSARCGKIMRVLAALLAGGIFAALATDAIAQTPPASSKPAPKKPPPKPQQTQQQPPQQQQQQPPQQQQAEQIPVVVPQLGPDGKSGGKPSSEMN